MTFAEKYGPWALVAGASDGVGAAFAEGLAERGLNVVLVARRQAVLDDVYCAGADPNFEPFLAHPIATAEAMVHRNCVVPMQLCHHFAPAMVERRSGGIVIFGSGAGLAGGPNMVAYGATKAFDMVFAEALWSRGVLASEDQAPTDADSVEQVVGEAFENLGNGPTLMVGDMMRAAVQMLGSVTRNEAVNFMVQAQAAAMGSD